MSTAAPLRVAVYGEVDLNLLDGSSVWLQSVSLMLAVREDVHVTTLLRVPETRTLLTAPLHEHPRITVVDPKDLGFTGRRVPPEEAITLLAGLDAEEPFDIVLLRGSAVTKAALDVDTFDGRLWIYYVPPHGEEIGTDAEYVHAITSRGHRVLCQTEGIRARVLATEPESGPRLVLLPPMVPDLVGPDALEPATPTTPLRRLFYAGKFSPEYFFLEMVGLLTRLREHLPDVELHMAGDKIHNPKDDPEFKPAVERALADTPGLVWHGAVERARVRELLREADVALSMRHPSMDASTELSTKILEYGAAGRPVLLNRNPVHVGLLGEDYPLLAGDLQEAVDVLLAAAEQPALRGEAARRTHAAAQAHTITLTAHAISPHLRRPSSEPRRLAIAGHSLKFMGRIPEWAGAAGMEVREDVWRKHTEHDEEFTAAMAEWADTVFCEWCLGNAGWYSRNKRPGQRLVVRFHRMELETPYPGDVDLDAVDAFVFVAEHVRDQALEKYGWTLNDRMHIVPNAIDTHRFDKPKLPGAAFTLGMIGWVPSLKRVDRALDLIERLRARDDRFRLLIKGAAPWDFYWMINKPGELEYFRRTWRRLTRSPLLRDGVHFLPFGDDIAETLQQIGIILSCSDIEGHPVALAEGLASGAAPVVFGRAGTEVQYPADWVVHSVPEAVRRVRELSLGGGLAAEAQRARGHVAEWSEEALAPVWADLLGV